MNSGRGESNAPIPSDSLHSLRPGVRRALPWVIGMRFVSNIGIRMAYSYLPAFARGAAVSESTMGVVLGVRDLTALSAPLAGRTADRVGTGRVMAFSGVGGAIGLAIAATGSIGLVIGLIAVGFFAVPFSVAMSAWIGHAVAYERRARVTGLIELSWGGAAMVGVPLMGFLIDQFGWRAAPSFLAVLALPLSLMLARQTASISSSDSSSTSKPVMNRAALGALTVYTTLAISAQFIFISHGLWLEDTYSLTIAQIGGVVFAAAVMEVLATIGTARITDVIGKRRAILGGATLMTISLFGLALFPASSLVLAVVLLGVVFLGFEFAIVSAIPLIAELDPNARAAMVGRATAMSTVFRAIVSLLAVGLYNRLGFGSLMGIAATFAAISIALAAFVMEEPVLPDLQV